MRTGRLSLSMQNMRSPGYCDLEWQSFRLEGPPKKIILEGPGARINITTSLDQADGRVRNIFGHFPPASGTTSFGQEFIKLKRIELNGNDPRHNKKAKK